MTLSVGVIGGGQLARMMVPPAIELGLDIRVLAESAGESAGIAVTQLGDYRSAEDVLRFAQGVDVVTFDHEHVPQAVLRALVDAGVAVRPGPDALLFAQDKLRMRERLGALGLPFSFASHFAPQQIAEALQAQSVPTTVAGFWNTGTSAAAKAAGAASEALAMRETLLARTASEPRWVLDM